MAKLNKKTILTLLDKLSPEAKAVSPIVKQGTEAGERLVTESQLAPSQKIIEKLPSSEEYAQKINSLRRAAGVTGAIGASSLISQEEAEAAGIETIARKVGVSLAEAAKIKEMALKKLPTDIFEENIKAIQTVSQYKKDPKSFKKIGSGVDFRALDVGDDKVLKAPKDLTQDNDIFRIAPGIMEQAELGPKTKTISVGDKSYMVQDKVKPSDEMFKGATRHDDKVLDDMLREVDSMWRNVDINDPKQVAAINADPKMKALEASIENRKRDIYKEKGFDVNSLLDEYRSIPEDKRWLTDTNEEKILSDPESSFENIMDYRATKKVGNVIRPLDLHSANVGFNKQGKPVAFDTSRFTDFEPKNLSDAQREAIMKANIALPEKKKALADLLNQSGDIKKAAAIAPMASMNPQEVLMKKPFESVKDAYTSIRKPVLDATRKVGEFISDTVRIPGVLTEDQKQYERDMAGTAAEIALDPTNALAPGAGLAMGAADLMLYKPEEEMPQETQEELQARIKREQINNLRLK